jgi:hypothetical protein
VAQPSPAQHHHERQHEQPFARGSNHTCDAEGFQPFCHGCHHEDVNAALP